jgi:hypothetical protein
MFAFNGLVKHDLETGTEEVLDAPDGVFVSEAPMAPRDNSTAEDDGYLLTFVSDVPNDRSECWGAGRVVPERRSAGPDQPARADLERNPLHLVAGSLIRPRRPLSSAGRYPVTQRGQ